uniref:Secreted protein n=1 Tax=Romanomermis culicivorax TaxID=13658 RepID=A0A915KB57_ROMCU
MTSVISYAAFILQGTATVTAAVTNRILVHVTRSQSYLTSVFCGAAKTLFKITDNLKEDIQKNEAVPLCRISKVVLPW